MAVAMAELPTHPDHFHVEPDNQTDNKVEQRRRLRDLLNFRKWSKSEEQPPCPDPKQETPPQTPVRPGVGRRFSRKGFVGLPRSTTFKRQEEEQRKNLTPVEPTVKERRDVSKVRQRAVSAVPDPPRKARRERSVPPNLRDAFTSIDERIGPNTFTQLPQQPQDPQEQVPPPPPPPAQSPPNFQEDEAPMSEASYDDEVDEELAEELKKKWILNLSMHFRDKTPREKFFLTYAETPDRWKRVTVSCDYRDAPQDSLEADLQSLHYQKDKSARVYESIRMSLPDIQFYDTVTNLKLETKDERLHVHVTEDVNEIIPYPSVHLVKHLSCRQYKESELHFDEHMSGFVYRVNVGEHTWIKKEIPGPDSVDEFLYEVNALSELVNAKNVIQLKGLVVNEDKSLIKGLLLSYADQGALIDILYDSKEGHIPRVPWERRERWAKQIVQGLSNIHEASFVQGDFTLSNIVIDENDEAQIIDINRRGCPVGWESPEMVPLVESGQRLSMYIGVKSDVYQLGMVLWALAMEKDEPERQPRPLTLDDVGADVPDYYRDLAATCLAEKSNQRLAAKDLLALFKTPSMVEGYLPCSSKDTHALVPTSEHWDGSSTVHVEGADVIGESFRERQSRYEQENLEVTSGNLGSQRSSRYRSRDQKIDESKIFRGRRYSPARIDRAGIPLNGSPSLSISRVPIQPLKRSLHQRSFASDNISPGQSESGEAQIISISPTGDREWEEINMDGTPYLIHRDTLDDFDDEVDFANVDNARRGKNVERWRRDIEHVDSGLADMDLTDLAPRERVLMELAGVGGHESLTIDKPEIGAGGKQADTTHDLGIEHNDHGLEQSATPTGASNGPG
ncbi:MAG: hypothetical protein ASARMPREDX12_003004 [Alectoria sarmentosa]|nr:MAG: hypothetical protein ASARMPREDX12_003004 [Alectoria sarmentosa]